MARLTVRGLPDGLVAALEARAAQAGRSVEAEHRHILENALRPALDPGHPGATPARRIKRPLDTPGAMEPPRRDRGRGEPSEPQPTRLAATDAFADAFRAAHGTIGDDVELGP